MRRDRFESISVIDVLVINSHRRDIEDVYDIVNSLVSCGLIIVERRYFQNSADVTLTFELSKEGESIFNVLLL